MNLAFHEISLLFCSIPHQQHNTHLYYNIILRHVFVSAVYDKL